MADKKRVKTMETAVEAKRKAYDAAAEAASKIETKVQKVHSKIMELTEGKMNKAREKLDAVTTQITKVFLTVDYQEVYFCWQCNIVFIFLGEFRKDQIGRGNQNFRA